MEKSVGVRSAKLADGFSSSPTPAAKRTKSKSTASSRRDALVVVSVKDMRKRPKLTVEQKRRLAALENLPDDKIDYSDIPEMTEADFNRPHWIGLHYHPGKKSVTIRLDDDIVKWFKAQGKGWQTKMNWVLRLYFASHRKTGVKVGRP